MDFEQRRHRLVSRVSESCDAFLVTALTNVTWLTGFTASNAAVVVTDRDVAIATDSRYQDQAALDAPEIELAVGRSVAVELISWCSRRGVTRLGFESEHVTVADLAIWEPLAGESGIDLVPIRAIVESLREIKDAQELALLAYACEISVAALEQTMELVRVGATEVQLARSLELAMAQHGAADRAFETIVATGRNSAVPHHAPTDRPIAVGDLLKIDFGARVAGYHADCTRTFVVGAEPTQWQQEIHAVVAASAEAGRGALAAGVQLAQIDAAARHVVAEAGYGARFTHGLGHGVGLEIHESPLIAASAVGILHPGVVVTIEPGVYLPGLGGVRIEDTCAIVGSAMTILTRMDRDLVRLG